MSLSAAQMNAAIHAVDASDRYVAGSISWCDGKRGVTSANGVPSLSCLGNNITDCSIGTAEGGVCQFMRSENHNETVGVVDPDAISMVDSDGTPQTTREILATVSDRARYMGYTAVEVGNVDNIVVRFQTVWVPIKRGTDHTKIVPQHYSYQTFTRSNPRNLILVGTPRGVFVHSDAACVRGVGSASNGAFGGVPKARANVVFNPTTHQYGVEKGAGTSFQGRALTRSNLGVKHWSWATRAIRSGEEIVADYGVSLGYEGAFVKRQAECARRSVACDRTKRRSTRRAR